MINYKDIFNVEDDNLLLNAEELEELEDTTYHNNSKKNTITKPPLPMTMTKNYLLMIPLLPILNPLTKKISSPKQGTDMVEKAL
jgi:hypothetical protein